MFFDTVSRPLAEAVDSNPYVTLLATFILVSSVYGLALAIYRLTFHPLAKFPGPKIAAATGWYEFYYDVIKRGQYVFEIEKMHQVYGKSQPFEFDTETMGSIEEC